MAYDGKRVVEPNLLWHLLYLLKCVLLVVVNAPIGPVPGPDLLCSPSRRSCNNS
jgi:hypothetical protein